MPDLAIGVHAHGWFSQVFYLRRLSAADLLSLVEGYLLLVPVNAEYRFSNYTTLLRISKIFGSINNETLSACHPGWGRLSRPNWDRW